jgi:hypothetical protein
LDTTDFLHVSGPEIKVEKTNNYFDKSDNDKRLGTGFHRKKFFEFNVIY